MQASGAGRPGHCTGSSLCPAASWTQDVDFSEFDLFYIVPVRTASKITFSPAYIDDAPYWGWPAWVVLDGTNITHGVTTGQDAWSYWKYKVLNHETNHTFGLPDLYAFDGQWTWTGSFWLWDYHYFVGGWDLMGLISDPAPDLFAWHKWKLGGGDMSRIRESSGHSPVRERL